MHWTVRVGSKDLEQYPIGLTIEKMVTDSSLVEKINVQVGQPKTSGVVI